MSNGTNPNQDHVPNREPDDQVKAYSAQAIDRELKARLYRYFPPVLNYSEEALSDLFSALAGAFPTEALAPLKLRAKNMVEARVNAERLAARFEADQLAANAETKAEVIEVKTDLKRLIAEEQIKRSKAAIASARAGLRFDPEKPSAEAMLGEAYPPGAVAADHGLPSPVTKRNLFYVVGTRWLGIFGVGPILGLALGWNAAPDQMTTPGPTQVVSLVIAALVGICLMTLMNTFGLVGRGIGNSLYHLGAARDKPYLTSLLKWTICLGFGVLFWKIETSVESKALLRAFLADHSTDTVTAQAMTEQYGWIAQILTVPVLAATLLVNLNEGERLANLDRLRLLQTQLNEAKRREDGFAEASASLDDYAIAREAREAAEARLKQLTASLKTELTWDQRCRIDELELAAAGASWEFGAEVRALLQLPPWPPPPAKPPRPSWWQRFIRCLQFTWSFWKERGRLKGSGRR